MTRQHLVCRHLTAEQPHAPSATMSPESCYQLSRLALPPSATRHGNQRSHWIWNPGRCTSRSAGSGTLYSGRISATFARNKDGDPNQPTRSANVEAGIVGVTASNTRTWAANASKLDPLGSRSAPADTSVTDPRPTHDRPFLARHRAVELSLVSTPYPSRTDGESPPNHPIGSPSIVVGGPVFSWRFWPCFQLALTAGCSTLKTSVHHEVRSGRTASDGSHAATLPRRRTTTTVGR